MRDVGPHDAKRVSDVVTNLSGLADGVTSARRPSIARHTHDSWKLAFPVAKHVTLLYSVLPIELSILDCAPI